MSDPIYDRVTAEVFDLVATPAQKRRRDALVALARSAKEARLLAPIEGHSGRIRDALRLHPEGLRVRDIVAATGITSAIVSSSLWMMQRNGKVTSVESATEMWRGKPIRIWHAAE